VEAEDPSQSETFTIHKDVLCHYSPFFDDGFNDKASESKKDLLTIKGIEAAVFGLLVFWLYSGKIAKQKVGVVDEYTLSQTLTQLAKLWLLAYDYKMPELQNDIIGEIFSAVDIAFVASKAFNSLRKHLTD
jgi:BTB/POZ domain